MFVAVGEDGKPVYFFGSSFQPRRQRPGKIQLAGLLLHISPADFVPEPAETGGTRQCDGILFISLSHMGSDSERTVE